MDNRRFLSHQSTGERNNKFTSPRTHLPIGKYPFRYVAFLLLAMTAASCNQIAQEGIVSINEEGALVKHQVSLDRVTVWISLPKEYIPATKEIISSTRFYLSDVARLPLDPVYISTSDIRSHVSIRKFHRGNEVATTAISDTIFDTYLKELFLMHKEYNPELPLIEKHLTKEGYPYAYVMQVARYDSSDSLWRNSPNTHICPIGADSVECTFYYYTLRGDTEYIIQYYSLDSFESFSYMDKRAVIESVDIMDVE